VDCLQCHFGKERIRQCGFEKVLPGVFVLHLSPFYAQDPQQSASSLVVYQHNVSSSIIEFSLLQHVNTLLWPFRLYSRPGACWTVPAVPDPLALPL
jgi:hypothetical protein